MSFQLHLTTRGLVDTDVCAICTQTETVSFYLYNLSGQLTGYVRYNWLGNKKLRRNDKAKYYSFGKGVYGLHSIRPTTTKLYIVEGVWDAIALHRLGYAAIAVLTSNPIPIMGWVKTLPYRTIAILDGDAASNQLKKFVDTYILLPDGTDPNEMYQQGSLHPYILNN